MGALPLCVKMSLAHSLSGGNGYLGKDVTGYGKDKPYAGG